MLTNTLIVIAVVGGVLLIVGRIILGLHERLTKITHPELFEDEPEEE